MLSYLNSLPFKYGLQQKENDFEINFDVPSKCAESLISKKTDIALVPVAILPQLLDYQIVSNFCIGATGKVKSVILASQVPLTEIKNILLDYESRTSILLIKVLAENFWKIKPQWLNAQEGYEQFIEKNTAGLIIGDRALTLSKSYTYLYDLADEWKKFTNLPFVFAVWTSVKNIETIFVEKLNNALKFGIENIKNAVENTNTSQNFDKIKLLNYLTQNIDYQLDKAKIESMNLFFKMLKK